MSSISCFAFVNKTRGSRFEDRGSGQALFICINYATLALRGVANYQLRNEFIKRHNTRELSLAS